MKWHTIIWFYYMLNVKCWYQKINLALFAHNWYISSQFVEHGLHKTSNLQKTKSLFSFFSTFSWLWFVVCIYTNSGWLWIVWHNDIWINNRAVLIKFYDYDIFPWLNYLWLKKWVCWWFSQILWCRALMEEENDTRRELKQKYHGPCMATNPIDSCWRCRKHWAQDRFRLANCGKDFGDRFLRWWNHDP